MERKFVPLTPEQVNAAIRGELKLITRDGRDVTNVRLNPDRNAAIGKSTLAEIDGCTRYFYPSGRYIFNEASDCDLFVAELTPTPKTVKVNETVMGLKEALIFISNMITEQ